MVHPPQSPPAVESPTMQRPRLVPPARLSPPSPSSASPPPRGRPTARSSPSAPTRGRRGHDRRPPRPAQEARRPGGDAALTLGEGGNPKMSPAAYGDRRSGKHSSPPACSGPRRSSAPGRTASSGHRGHGALRRRRHPTGEAHPRRHPLEEQPAPGPRSRPPHRERGGAAGVARRVRFGAPAAPRPRGVYYATTGRTRTASRPTVRGRDRGPRHLEGRG